MPEKVFHGARAKVYVLDANTQQPKLAGVFNSVSWGLVYDAQPVYILGNLRPVESAYTAQEPISVTASGFRVVNAGPHTVPSVPLLSNLLTHEYIVLQISDRQTGQTIAQVGDVRPTGYSTSLTARNLEEITVTFMGLLLDDEFTLANGTNEERADASQLS